MYQNLALFTAFLLVYSIFAGRFEKRLFNGPLVFMLVGIVLGPALLGILQPRIDKDGLRALAELTLAIVLFSDAANANLKVLRAHEGLPLRLLLIGLPLTIVLGWLVGLWVFPQVRLIELAILATLLAPTDAALGKAVVTNPKVAEPVREGLNVESGLNDGICVPVLLLFLALLVEEQAQHPVLLALELVAEELGIGALSGVLLTLIAWQLQKLSWKHQWQMQVWSQLTLPGLAVLCFATAQVLGGSGFIAAFVGGLLAGYLFKDQKHHLLQASEEFASLLSVLTWGVFGAVVIPKAWSSLTWDIWLYALLSLTLVRMLPVLLCLLGTRFDLETRLFMAWFGPRGLATIVFAVMIIDYPLASTSTLVATAICTVLLSVLLHGLSANPWVARLVRRTP
ncbi:sodium:proton antiporter [Pseudomonas sp. FFUP_PS_473]|uniref:cation:proton antiporter n=1 Tax=Pseudomonas TaxID=286 RepID=UPI0008119240|nr:MULTISPECIES: cation:proton antiporter [Pseudomonas]ATR83333.1 sodium:proton antiporter [Pseudomonas sp. HLS-6]MEE3634216.1 cation:proton antiporter [Pseudomonas sp. AL 58]PLP94106.1 sodium:proton antiporter [Pseudomonas sp. FFUP_PS_473]WJM95255.1 cation:proton antiporter [Pseudomonas defluvii]